MEYIEFANRLCMLALRAEKYNQTSAEIISEMLFQAELYREKWNEMEEQAIEEAQQWNQIYG